MSTRLALAISCILLAYSFARGAAPPDIPPVAAKATLDDEIVKELAEVIEVLQEAALIAPRREELAGWASRAVFRQRSKDLPLELARRLKAKRPLDGRALRALLRDAHARAYPRGAITEARPVFHEAIRFMLRQFDPNAAWEIPRPYNASEGPWRPSFPGVRFAIDARTQMPRVITPLKDSPAYLAGIRANDVITHITPASKDSVPRKGPVSTRGLPPEQVEDLLGGDHGERLRLTVRREGTRRPLVFAMKLGFTKPETVLGWQRRPDDSWDHWLDRENKIGYVRISPFSRDTTADLNRVMIDLLRGGLKGLVLDLRFNPGGRFLGQALSASDVFIDDGLIMTIRPRVGKASTFRGRHPGSLLGFPMVCLVNGETAYVTEVVAACLQDHKRALIAGERSKGHAGVQNVQDIGDYELSLTTAVLYRPSGGKLDRRRLPGRPADEWGVTPSPGMTVPLSEAERERLRQDLEQSEYLYLRGRGRPAVVLDRQHDVALAGLRKQLKLPAR